MRFFYVLNALNKGLTIGLPLLLPILRQTISITDFQIGLITGVAMVSSIVTILLLPPLLHRMSAWSLFALALVAFAVACGVLILSIDVYTLTLSFVCMGIGSGIIESLSDAQIARNAPPGKIAGSLANLGVWGDSGRIMFSIGAVWIAMTIGVSGFTSILLIVVIVFCIWLARITIYTPHESSHTVRRSLGRPYWYVQITKGLDSYASSSLTVFLPYLFLSQGFRLSDTGLMSAVYFVGYMAGRRIFGAISDRRSSSYALRVAEVCMAIVIVCMLFTSSYVLLVILTFVMGASIRGTAPVIKSMTAHTLHPDQYERGYSISQLVDKIANTLNRFVSGYLFAVYGIQSVFVVSAIVALAAIIPTYSSSLRSLSRSQDH